MELRREVGLLAEPVEEAEPAIETGPQIVPPIAAAASPSAGDTADSTDNNSVPNTSRFSGAFALV